MAFFTGGAKIHAATSYTKDELKERINDARISGEPGVWLDTVNESEDVLDDELYIEFDKLLFCTIIIPKLDSSVLVRPPAGQRVPLQ